MKSKGLEMVGAGLVAAVAIACGEAAINGGAGMMGGAGGMLEDAGEAMMDAGEMMMRDAGEVVRDAGGGMVRDAGEMMRDAGEMMRDASTMIGDASDLMNDSAMAQSCEACSAGGRQQIVTADQDLDQLRGGTIERDGWTEVRSAAYTPISGSCAATYESRAHVATLAEGPLVITDFRSSGTLSVYVVASGASCYETVTQALFDTCGTISGWSAEVFQRPLNARSLLLNASTAAARVVVGADEKVCALTNVQQIVATGLEATNPPAIAVWSGFVPYE